MDERSEDTLSHIYRAPEAHAVLPAERLTTSRSARLLWISVGLASGSIFLALLGRVHAVLDVIIAFGFMASAIAAAGGALNAMGQWASPVLRPRGAPAIAANLGLLVGNSLMALVGALIAWMSTFGFVRGRQLRRLGRVLLPPVVQGRSWANTKVSIVAPAPIPIELAAQWRENGRTEHASVAAFARLVLDLMALGAPPHLLAAAQADAIDEVRHTELCFSLARSIDGQALDPGPFPEAKRARTSLPTRTAALAALAVDSLIDGALHEGVSARIIAKLAKRSDVPAIRGMLKEIASDEGRHAAHGWDVVEWCLGEGGRPVASALLGALGSLPEVMRSPLPAAAVDGSWERWGIHGEALEQAEYAAARAALVDRVRALVERTARAA